MILACVQLFLWGKYSLRINAKIPVLATSAILPSVTSVTRFANTADCLNQERFRIICAIKAKINCIKEFLSSQERNQSSVNRENHTIADVESCSRTRKLCCAPPEQEQPARWLEITCRISTGYARHTRFVRHQRLQTWIISVKGGHRCHEWHCFIGPGGPLIALIAVDGNGDRCANVCRARWRLEHIDACTQKT